MRTEARDTLFVFASAVGKLGNGVGNRCCMLGIYISTNGTSSGFSEIRIRLGILLGEGLGFLRDKLNNPK
jgi:hypothetical protein